MNIRWTTIDVWSYQMLSMVWSEIEEKAIKWTKENMWFEKQKEYLKKKDTTTTKMYSIIAYAIFLFVGIGQKLIIYILLYCIFDFVVIRILLTYVRAYFKLNCFKLIMSYQKRIIHISSTICPDQSTSYKKFHNCFLLKCEYFRSLIQFALFFFFLLLIFFCLLHIFDIVAKYNNNCDL